MNSIFRVEFFLLFLVYYNGIQWGKSVEFYSTVGWSICSCCHDIDTISAFQGIWKEIPIVLIEDISTITSRSCKNDRTGCFSCLIHTKWIFYGFIEGFRESWEFSEIKIYPTRFLWKIWFFWHKNYFTGYDTDTSCKRSSGFLEDPYSGSAEVFFDISFDSIFIFFFVWNIGYVLCWKSPSEIDHRECYSFFLESIEYGSCSIQCCFTCLNCALLWSNMKRYSIRD